jgi:Leucine-rich repeat (LRR) protein
MIFKFLIITLAFLKFQKAWAQQCTFQGCSCLPNSDNTQSIYCSGSQTTTSFPTRTGFNDNIPIKLLRFELYNVARLTNIFTNLNIDTLELKQNKLQFIGNNAFSGIKSLRQLTLQDYTLKNTSFEFGSVDPIASTLNGLEISSSGINTDEFNSMYGELFKLSKLSDLNLNQNDFDRLDSKWTTFPLKSLNMARNNLNQIQPDFIQKANQLAVLDLSQNHFSDMTGLINTLRASPTNTLKDLSLRGNSIQNIVSFPQFALIRLDMSENMITTINADSFSNLGALTTLILKNNNINSVSPQAFSSNFNLNSLDLSNNFLKAPPSILYLSALNFLDLSNQNGQLVSLPDKAFDRVKVNANNLNLNLKSNSITQFGPQSFCTTSFTSTPSISTLQLSYASALAIDKCFIKQMSQQSIQNDVIVAIQKEANADYSTVCGCYLKVFYNNFRIKLSDACDSSITGCNVQVTDDCGTKGQCPQASSTIIPITSTTSASVTTTTVGATTGISTSSTNSPLTSSSTYQTGASTNTGTSDTFPTPTKFTTINYNKNSSHSNKGFRFLNILYLVGILIIF